MYMDKGRTPHPMCMEDVLCKWYGCAVVGGVFAIEEEEIEGGAQVAQCRSAMPRQRAGAASRRVMRETQERLPAHVAAMRHAIFVDRGWGTVASAVMRQRTQQARYAKRERVATRRGAQRVSR